jgi:hypothetical protein
MNLSKFITLNLTGLTLIIATISIGSDPAISGEPIRDRNCQFHDPTKENYQKITPQNRGKSWLTKMFQVNNQRYYLRMLRFPDSTGVFCMGIANKQLPKRLINAELIQNKLIEKFEQDASQATNYIVKVKGGKNENFLRTTYRLNLNNPQQPKLTKILVVYKR